MIASKCLALMFSLVILMNAFVVRRIVGTWLFPAVLFALFWFAFTFLPLVVLFTVPVNPWSVAFICCGTIAFSLSALTFFKWKRALRLNRRKPRPVDYFNTPFLRAVFYWASLFSLVCFYLGMVAQGFTPQDMWFGMLETASAYAQMRYTNELAFSIYAKLSLPLAFLAVTTGGLLFGCARSRRQSVLTLLGAFLPAVATMLLQSAKGMLFGFIALFFGGILVTRIFAGRLHVINKATIRASLLALAVVVPLTFLSFMGRGLGGLEDSELKDALSHYALSYAFGNMYAFSDWLSFRIGQVASLPYPTEASGYGFYTFMSLFRMFGSAREVPLGVYDDFFMYHDILTTNIFTIYRGLIIDFGMVGALFYMFISGFAIHLSFYFLLMKRRPVVSVAVFIFTVYYFYMNYLASVLTWNTIPLVAIGLSCCLYVNNRSVRRWPARVDGRLHYRVPDGGLESPPT